MDRTDNELNVLEVIHRLLLSLNSCQNLTIDKEAGPLLPLWLLGIASGQAPRAAQALSVPNTPVFRRACPSRRAFGENCPSNARIFVIMPVYL